MMPDRPERDEPGRLDEAILDCLERMESSGLEALEAIEAVAQERPEVSEGLRRRMRLLLRSGLLEDPSAGELPERLGDFRLLSVLGTGGMGTVYLARQESIDREVALKVVRPELLFFPDARRRFEREVAALARLEHPGIVPVHAVGEEGGVPFLAMARVRGANLAEVLAAAGGSIDRGQDLLEALGAALEPRGLRAGDDPEPAPLFTGTWAEACVGLCEQVALALDHAHRHGVLHRDVKPSNVLLTPDGRAHLFDFGLARLDEASEITSPGTAVGSLPYMAPEVLEERPADRRTDVYGLGLVLFELLAGRPAFGAGSELQLRRAILAGDLPPLRGPGSGRGGTAVPRDYESVCRKACAREPERRYASAAEFARDLRNLLELRPVSARPQGPLGHLRTWVRRHPARAVAAVSVAALAVVGPLVFGFQQRRAADRLGRALDQVERERTRAEGNLDRALEAVQTMLVEVGDEDLEGLPGMDAVRARLLEKSLALFDELLPQRGEDPELLLRRARLLLDRGRALDQLGRSGEDLADLREACELFEELAPSGGRDARLEFGSALIDLSTSLRNQARDEEALEPGARAIEVLSELVDEADPFGWERLWRAHLGRAAQLERLTRLDEALVELERAHRAAERLRALEPSADALFALAQTVDAESSVRAELGQRDTALELSARALELLRPLCAVEDPAEDHLYRLGWFCSGYASELMGADRFELGAEIAAEGRAAAERLVLDHPDVPRYRSLLATILNMVAFGHLGHGDAEAALPLLLRQAEECDRLVELRPDSFTWRVNRALGYVNLANVLLELGRPLEARPEAARAVDQLERLLDEHADEPRLEHHGVPRSSFTARMLEAQAATAEGHYPDMGEFERLRQERAEGPIGHMLLALLASVSSEAMRADEALGLELREERVEELVALAIDEVGRAIDAGYSSLERLETTRELDPLRSRPAFQRQVDRLR